MVDDLPKMAKHANDPCYGQSFANVKDSCRRCWISKSCENNYKANVKKAKMGKKGKVVKVREKKYKKTDKHRDWM